MRELDLSLRGGNGGRTPAKDPAAEQRPVPVVEHKPPIVAFLDLSSTQDEAGFQNPARALGCRVQLVPDVSFLEYDPTPRHQPCLGQSST
jgi:hypothetical protein